MVRIWMYVEGTTNIIGEWLDMGEKDGVKNDYMDFDLSSHRSGVVPS